MSIATMSARTHSMTPGDELIGSLTPERVKLAVTYAGAQSIESSYLEAQHWLTYALNTGIPANAFRQVCAAFEECEHIESGDLDFWFGGPNTEAHREALRQTSDETLAETISRCTNLLVTELGLR